MDKLITSIFVLLLTLSGGDMVHHHNEEATNPYSNSGTVIDSHHCADHKNHPPITHNNCQHCTRISSSTTTLIHDVCKIGGIDQLDEIPVNEVFFNSINDYLAISVPRAPPHLS